MANTEIFELDETSFKIQCPDWALYWEVSIVYCTCVQPTEENRQLNKERFDVLSIPDYFIDKNPSHGARHGPSVRQTMHFKAHDVLRNARSSKKMVIVKLFWKDGTQMTNTERLCQILGGLKNR